MGRAKLKGQSGGANINGVIEEYTIKVGETIKTGDFLDYLSGEVKKHVSNFENNGYTGVTNFNLYPSYHIVALKLSTTKFLILFRDGTNNYGTAIIGTLSNTNTFTFSSKFVFLAKNTVYMSAEVVDDTHVLITCINGTDSLGVGIILTVDLSTNAMSASSPTTWKSAQSHPTSLTKVDRNMYLLAYADTSNSQYGTAVMLNVTSTYVISIGSPLVFASYMVDDFYNEATMLFNSNTVVVGYQWYANGRAGSVRLLSISGATITLSTQFDFYAKPNGAKYISLQKINDNGIFVVFRDVYGTQYVYYTKIIVNGTVLTGTTPITLSVTNEYISTEKLSDNYMLSISSQSISLIKIEGDILTVKGTIKLDSNSRLFNKLLMMDGEKCLIVCSDDTITYGKVQIIFYSDLKFGVAKASGVGGNKIKVYK